MEILGEMSHEYLDRWRHAISARRLVRPGALESALIRWRKHRHTGVGIRLQRGGSPTNGAGRAVRFRLTRCKTLPASEASCGCASCSVEESPRSGLVGAAKTASITLSSWNELAKVVVSVASDVCPSTLAFSESTGVGATDSSFFAALCDGGAGAMSRNASTSSALW